MNEELIHYGVIGQKWGVITKREGTLRSKAANVVSTQKDLSNQTKSDVKSAKWMSQPLSSKVTQVVLPVVTSAAVYYGMTKALKVPMSKKAMFKVVKEATTTSIALAVTKEAQGRSVLRRYDEKGNRDLTKKQYKSLTPETIIAIGAAVGFSAYRVYNGLGLKNYKSVKSDPSKTKIGQEWVSNYIDPAHANETNAQWRARMGANEAAAGFG